MTPLSLTMQPDTVHGHLQKKCLPSGSLTVNNTRPQLNQSAQQLADTHRLGSRLPGRPWNRCPSRTGGCLAPHRRHLGILGAAVQVCELLQLGLSDLIIVILHTERQRVHTHRQQQTCFQLHCIKLRPLSPGLQPREYLINVLYSTAVTAVPEAAKHSDPLLINPRDPVCLYLLALCLCH